jgi:hypothetical protein
MSITETETEKNIVVADAAPIIQCHNQMFLSLISL